jgi:hypothetical protein
VLLAAMLLAFAGPRPAWAQQPTAPVAPVAPSRPAGWVVTPAVGVAALWDDNVALASRDQREREDLVTDVSPSLSLGFRGRSASMTLDYRGSYAFHRELSEFDAADHRGRLEFDRRIGRRVTLFVRDAFTWAPTTEAAGPDIAVVVLTRRTTQFNDFRGGLDILAGPRTTITAAYGSQWIHLERDDLVSPLLRGGHAHLADFSLRQRVSPRVSIGAMYDVQRAIVADGGDQFDVQGASALLEIDLARSLRMEASAGYAWLAPGRQEERRDAPAYGVDLVYGRGRTSWELGYGRSFVPSFGFGGTVQNEEVRGGVRAALGRRWSLSAQVAGRENDALDVTETSLRSITAQGTLAVQPSNWARLELFALYAFQDAQRAGGQIARTQAGVRVTTLHAVRVR